MYFIKKYVGCNFFAPINNFPLSIFNFPFNLQLVK